MLKRMLASVLTLGLLLPALPARAAVVFSFSSEGIVFPADLNCQNPFAGCPLTALGQANALGGNVVPLPGPWHFTAVFAIDPATLRTTGVFDFDDPSPADNDFSGSLDGLLNPATFTNSMTYAVTHGSGLFAAGHGVGSSLIQIIPQGELEPFAFVERGQFAIPEPGTLALLGLGLAGLAAARRRRR